MAGERRSDLCNEVLGQLYQVEDVGCLEPT
jgi:hypothetical protein